MIDVKITHESTQPENIAKQHPIQPDNTKNMYTMHTTRRNPTSHLFNKLPDKTTHQQTFTQPHKIPDINNPTNNSPNSIPGDYHTTRR